MHSFWCVPSRKMAASQVCNDNNNVAVINVGKQRDIYVHMPNMSWHGKCDKWTRLSTTSSLLKKNHLI